MNKNARRKQVRDRQRSQRRRKSKRRQKVQALILCIFAVILVLGAALLYQVLKPEKSAVSSTDISDSTSSTSQETKETAREPESLVIASESDTSKEEAAESEHAFSQINTATEDHHKTNGLAICMYHYVYDENNPPEDLNNNYIEVKALEEELQYLKENDYYFPSWEEVRQYVDGDLLLPEKSIVLTFDDGAKSFLELGAPLFDKYEIPVTSFLITSKDGENKVAKYESDFVTFQSHSDNMHRAGGSIGHGGIFTALSVEEGVTDLKKSIEICGNGDAFAYPFGDYSDSCVAAVEEEGFLCAVTTEYDRVYPGDNPYLLPRVRMLLDQSLDSFISAVE
ncbi:MAG: polysaccharide deacetylase family protein [Ruminococcus sp.]|nr:polysaccharide deacetylase family protein [Ruminococcus sp.]